ncbi:hypothetical protein SSS_01985 [Sarcoptes scabiei]|uniref:Uncharacterized protein n=1 Tax=Sarcoptes scabiei TaxID=52283 RepID=A0A834VF60_SARSC|nr:hypothetical protein SSS_01985 [Sarcoptes scabiei]
MANNNNMWPEVRYHERYEKHQWRFVIEGVRNNRGFNSPTFLNHYIVLKMTMAIIHKHFADPNVFRCRFDHDNCLNRFEFSTWLHLLPKKFSVSLHLNSLSDIPRDSTVMISSIEFFKYIFSEFRLKRFKVNRVSMQDNSTATILTYHDFIEALIVDETNSSNQSSRSIRPEDYLDISDSSNLNPHVRLIIPKYGTLFDRSQFSADISDGDLIIEYIDYDSDQTGNTYGMMTTTVYMFIHTALLNRWFLSEFIHIYGLAALDSGLDSSRNAPIELVLDDSYSINSGYNRIEKKSYHCTILHSIVWIIETLRKNLSQFCLKIDITNHQEMPYGGFLLYCLLLVDNHCVIAGDQSETQKSMVFCFLNSFIPKDENRISLKRYIVTITKYFDLNCCCYKLYLILTLMERIIENVWTTCEIIPNEAKLKRIKRRAIRTLISLQANYFTRDLEIFFEKIMRVGLEMRRADSFGNINVLCDRHLNSMKNYLETLKDFFSCDLSESLNNERCFHQYFPDQKTVVANDLDEDLKRRLYVITIVDDSPQFYPKSALRRKIAKIENEDNLYFFAIVPKKIILFKKFQHQIIPKSFKKWIPQIFNRAIYKLDMFGDLSYRRIRSRNVLITFEEISSFEECYFHSTMDVASNDPKSKKIIIERSYNRKLFNDDDDDSTDED